MFIREFVPSDLARVYQIEVESFSTPYELAILQQLYEIGAGFLVAVEDGEIVGYIIFWVKEEGLGHIIALAVDRKFKKEGEPSADFISCVAFGKTAEIVEKYDKLFDKYKIHCKDILEKINGFSDIFESQMRNWDNDEDAPKTFTTKELLYKELKYTVDTQKNLSSVVEMDEWSDSIAIENAIRVKDDTNLDIKSILNNGGKEYEEK